MPAHRKHQRIVLTPRLLQTLPAPAAGLLEYEDALMPGLVLRVAATGARTFAVRYSVRGGHVRRRVTIGSTPPVLLSEARPRAREILAAAQLGRDPAGPRSELPTLAELVSRYVTARAPALARKTVIEYRSIERRMADAPGGPAERLSRDRIRAWLDRIAQGAPVAANRIHTVVASACRWAVAEGMLERSPLEGIRPPRREFTRERVLSDAELVILWRETAGGSTAETALRLGLLLGQRPGEIVGMRWEDVDLEARRWTIPGPMRKGRAGHVVPLSDAVLSILRALPRRGAKVLPASGYPEWWMRVRDRVVAAGAAHFTRHDLRRTCATGCASLGTSPHVVARILGHRVGGVTAIYDRFDRLPEVAAALQAWGIHVLALAAGRRGEVVPIGRRA